jgi:carbon monoxide dehydrogenase subunit G
MKPITVATVVAQDPETVYSFLDCLSTHQQFTDHMLSDWTLSGPTRGVGAKVRAVATVGARREPVEIEVVEADPPRRIVERTVGRGGRRIAYGTYQLDPDPQDRTEITFRYSVAAAPVIERLLAPVIRPVMRRALNESMRRLHAQLSIPPQSARQARRSEEAA